MNELTMLGEKSIWELPKTAFLSSSKFSAVSVLKSYDFASEMKIAGRCVMSGFQSKLERDVFDFLLDGDSPLIMVLARGMFDPAPVKLRKHIASGRLLIVSTFDKRVKRPHRGLASKRNQFIVDNADEVVFGHIYSGGMLEQLAIRENVVVRVLDREDDRSEGK